MKPSDLTHAEVLASMQRLLADEEITGYEECDANGTAVNVVVTGLTDKGKLRLAAMV